MALPVIHNGYYYDVSPSGMVTVSGPGINNSGVSLSYLDTLSSGSFAALLGSTSVTASAKQALLAEAQSVGQIKASLVAAMQSPDTVTNTSDPAIAVAATAVASSELVVPGPAPVPNEAGSVFVPPVAVIDQPAAVNVPIIEIAQIPVVESQQNVPITENTFTIPTTAELVNVDVVIPNAIESIPVTPVEVIARTSTSVPTGPDTSPATSTTAVVAEPMKTVSTDTTYRPSNDFGLGTDNAPASSTNVPLSNTNTQTGATAAKAATLASAATTASALPDWRARLRLAPGADYLYKAQSPGILEPLKNTDGIIFPYTPAVQIAYSAHYENTSLTHSNYKVFQYGSSSVDSISITCDFTAQDTAEANYVLAVIHFIRSATKMFYGQDQRPYLGTPPPLCYLSGFGAFQFDEHPVAITSFNYTLPTDVDYIRAMPLGSYSSGSIPRGGSASSRLSNSNLSPGALTPDPSWTTYPQDAEPTYVPTKIQIQISAVPIVTRNDISNDFSLKKYATGALLRGSQRAGRGGIW